MAIQEFTTRELETETWLSVTQGNGIYSVSSIGRVRREKGYRSPNGRILKSILTNRGYFCVNIFYDRKTHIKHIHRLVAAAFISECPEGLQVNHIDGVKTNNRIENLEYVTPGENTRHAVRNGLMVPHYGGKNGMTKPRDAQISSIFELRKEGKNFCEIGAIVGYSSRHVRRILKGQARIYG